MKKATYASILARLMKPAAAALLLLVLTTAPAHAADKPKDSPVAVRYLGSPEGKPLFQITVNNPQGDEVALTVRDEEGYILYTDVVKDTTYIRTLKFDGMDTDRLKLTLSLRTKKDSQTQTFEIIKSTRTVEDIAVVSL